jgi:hypothetical protein
MPELSPGRVHVQRVGANEGRAKAAATEHIGGIGGIGGVGGTGGIGGISGIGGTGGIGGSGAAATGGNVAGE